MGGYSRSAPRRRHSPSRTKKFQEAEANVRQVRITSKTQNINKLSHTDTQKIMAKLGRENMIRGENPTERWLTKRGLRTFEVVE
ncbi:hypothetical protein CMI37_30055 [Candidatus Pacearchaeota archaeon]|nr:hypothetical protein [Candidatus Pacearchaeota archaeon]